MSRKNVRNQIFSILSETEKQLLREAGTPEETIETYAQYLQREHDRNQYLLRDVEFVRIENEDDEMTIEEIMLRDVIPYEEPGFSDEFLIGFSDPRLIRILQWATGQDKQILRMLADGYTQADIADELHTSRQYISNRIVRYREVGNAD